MTEGGDFIDLAAKMAVARSGSPAVFRTAISRAYYGAFHLAREMLAEMGYHCRVRENEHIFVQRHFANCHLPQAIEIAGLLSNLHESRKEADYEHRGEKAEASALAVLCVQRADRVRDHLRNCFREDLRAVIKAEMQAYRIAANIT